MAHSLQHHPAPKLNRLKRSRLMQTRFRCTEFMVNFQKAFNIIFGANSLLDERVVRLITPFKRERTRGGCKASGELTMELKRENLGNTQREPERFSVPNNRGRCFSKKKMFSLKNEIRHAVRCKDGVYTRMVHITLSHYGEDLQDAL